MDSRATDIAIIGSRVVANMVAAHLRTTLPELRVTIVGREDRQPPVVGESTTEYSSIFLRDIGMTEVLEKKHFLKHGLTFYFKEQLDDPGDRRYAVHEGVKPHPIDAYLVNRFSFDVDLAERSRELGAEFIDAKVHEVELGDSEDAAPDRHRLALKHAGGGCSVLTARWVIDASGRRRLLARQLGLGCEPKHQRGSFWFRLADFDEAILRSVDAVRTWEASFDPYYSAHHFLGRGNWIWGIPLASDEHRNLISVGITYRPDLVDRIDGIEDFLRQVEAEHPVLADLVRSGTVIDTNAYANYMYETPQLYSADGWFLVGDAADTSDPLYSTGLVMASIQATQVGEMIRRDLAGELTPNGVSDLESAYKTLRSGTQDEVASLYEVLHDPYQSHWRVHITSAAYFFFMLPQVMAGYLTDPVGARWVHKMGQLERGQLPSFAALVRDAAARVGPGTAEQIRNRYDVSVNWEIAEARDEDIPRYLAHLLVLLAQFRWTLLRDARWKGWHRHLPVCVASLVKAAVIWGLFRGQSLKQSPAIRRFVGL